MRSIAAAAIAVLWISIAACGSGEDETVVSCATSERPSYTLGLDEEQPIRLERGPQGGCHLSLTFHTAGLDGERARIRYQLTEVESGEVIIAMSATRNLEPSPDGGGACEVNDFRAFMGQRAWMADGKRVRIDTAITDFREVRAERSVTVKVLWPEPAPEVERELLCGPRSP